MVNVNDTHSPDADTRRYASRRRRKEAKFALDLYATEV